MTAQTTSRDIKHLSLPWTFAAAFGWVLFFLSTFFYITLILVVVAVLTFSRKAFAATGTTFSFWRETLVSALQHEPVQTNGVKTFLLLGLDSLETRPGSPVLTDSMVLVSVDLKRGSVKTLPLPRDLWLPDYQTKINALYWYGQEQSTDPSAYVATIISETTGQPIHHVIPITLDQVSTLIDAVGGVEVEIKEGFIDEQFPRTDVDVTKVTDPRLLYETVEFKPGKTKMNGELALKYMRSRKAAGDEGTDEARSRRQQQVLAALVTQLTHPLTLTSPEQLARMFGWYQHNFAQIFPIQEAASTGWALWPHKKNLVLTQSQLTFYPDDPKGTLWHPPLNQTANQWTYVIRDEAAFKQDVTQKLNSQSATNSATQQPTVLEQP